MKLALTCTALLAALALGAAPAQAQWSFDTPLSQSRGEIASVTAGNLTFHAGGLTFTGPSDVVDVYDAVSDTWSVLPPLSVPRRGIGATAVGNYVLFAGGGFPGAGQTPTVDAYNPVTGQWEQPGMLSQARSQIGATSVGGKAFFAGGVLTSGVAVSTVDVYDSTVGPPSMPAAWSVMNLSVARVYVAAEAVGNLAVFAGGTDFVTPTFDTVDIYDSSTNTWSVGPPLSQARAEGASTTVGNLAIFAGGRRDGAGTLSDVVDIFDGQTLTMSSHLLTAARVGLGVTAIGNNVLFASGATMIGPNPTGTTVVERFNVGTGRWDSVGPLSIARAFSGAASSGDRAYFAGGLDTGTTTTATVEVYAPVGVNYCGATQNSSGAAATIDASGSASLAANSLVLEATDVPNTAFLFFQGSNQAQLPFGDGFLCTTGGLVRLGQVQIASGGVALAQVDLPSAGIAAPGARRFQCWFRDVAAGGAGFNTSDALTITFVP